MSSAGVGERGRASAATARLDTPKIKGGGSKLMLSGGGTGIQNDSKEK